MANNSGADAKQLEMLLDHLVTGALDRLDKKEKKKVTREWIAIALTLLGWFGTVAYVAGSLGQRISDLEKSEASVQTSVNMMMGRDELIERLKDIQNQIDRQEKHLDYDDQRLDSVGNRR